MNVYIHHFLLYSETPESTFNSLKVNLNLPEVFPLTNFGYFKSGMLWMNNSCLEIVNYPKDIPAPNSNLLKSRFVGIALKIDLSPEDTLEFLKKNRIRSSEILDEDVLDKEGNKVNIAKIILLNDYFQDFRIFFVFHTNDFFDKKENELSNHKSYSFNKCQISISNSLQVIELFQKLGLALIDKETFVTSKHQEMQFLDSEKLATDIISFDLETNDKTINIFSELNA